MFAEHGVVIIAAADLLLIDVLVDYNRLQHYDPDADREKRLQHAPCPRSHSHHACSTAWGW
jgi:hypothetical protein